MSQRKSYLFATFVFWIGTILQSTLLLDEGNAEDARYLIIHSDDAGMSHAVNVATQEALRSGVVTSASIMVPCPWFKEFAVFAKENPKFDYGIHLTLNSEWDNYRWGPVSSKDLVSSLIDSEGYLWKNTDQVARNAKADEVKLELKAQIDRAIAFGVPLSHLDTHMGALVTRPDLVRVYVELGLEYDLPILFFKTMTPEEKEEYPAMASEHSQSTARLSEKGLPLIDKLLQYYGGENPSDRERQYLQAIRDLQPGVTQLIIHCGMESEELRFITTSHARRDQDRRLFSDPKTLQFIKERGVQLIDWRQFRQLVPLRREGR
jgi:predicted glycoside hydrolase/deacetylase ChbG (UPF0249 family)